MTGHQQPGSAQILYTIWDIDTGKEVKNFKYSHYNDAQVLLGNRYLFLQTKSTELIPAGITVVDVKSFRQVGRFFVGKPGSRSRVELKRSGDILIINGWGDYYVWPFELLLDGTVDDNPLLWITKINPESNNGMLQAHFIKRAYEATIAKQDLIIDMPQSLSTPQENETQAQRDGRTYFSFPEHVRQYLRDRLNIRR